MEGKVAVVTGATGGIGSEIARHLAAKGSSLVLTGLGSQEEIDSLVQKLSGGPGKVDFVPADLSKRDDVTSFCQRVLEIHPEGIHILINVAGVQFSHALEEYPPEKWDLMVALHLTAPFLLTQHFLPGMKKNRWGRIMNMASQMAFVSAAGRTPYTAVKAGLVGLTKGVAVEGAAFGVTCNALCPGFVDAPMFHRAMEVKAEAAGTTVEMEKADFQKKMCPNGRLITVQEVAETVCFLCSETAASISGASLLQDAAFTVTVPGLVTADVTSKPMPDI